MCKQDFKVAPAVVGNPLGCFGLSLLGDCLCLTRLPSALEFVTQQSRVNTLVVEPHFLANVAKG